jgi:hypothetical protein
MLRVSMHCLSNGTSVSMLVEDMSRNKCLFFQVRLWPIQWLSLV